MRGVRFGITRRRALALTASAIATPFVLPRQARSANEEGVTDSEIELETTATDSGPVSAIASYGSQSTTSSKSLLDSKRTLCFSGSLQSQFI
jgi:branched-chain amino acid transport system substrate-binding protein